MKDVRAIAIKRLLKHTRAKLVQCEDRQSWLAERSRSVGGSDSPAVLGVGSNEYSSRYSVWADKTTPGGWSESTERQLIGLGLEKFCCNLHLEKFGGKVYRWPSHTMARHPEREFIHATPDAVLWEEGREGPGSLSIKTWSEHDRKSWAQEPPLYVQIQLQQELAVLGWNWGVVDVLFNFESLERYYVERDEEFINVLLQQLEEFWSCVVYQIEPPLDHSAATAKALDRLHPNDNGLGVALPEQAIATLNSLEVAKSIESRAGKRADALANQLKAWIGDNTYGLAPDGRAYAWKTECRRKAKHCQKCGELVSGEVHSRVLRPRKNLPKELVLVDPSPPSPIPESLKQEESHV